MSDNESDKKIDSPTIEEEQSDIWEQTSNVKTLIKQYSSKKDHIKV